MNSLKSNLTIKNHEVLTNLSAKSENLRGRVFAFKFGLPTSEWNRECLNSERWVKTLEVFALQNKKKSRFRNASAAGRIEGPANSVLGFWGSAKGTTPQNISGFAIPESCILLLSRKHHSIDNDTLTLLSRDDTILSRGTHDVVHL